MEYSESIIRAFTKILESADAFRHGHEALFAGVSLTEIHCIDWIGLIDHANVTKIADAMDMTRGGVSKIVKRLLKKGYIESYREPENKKEIYFRLTEEGGRMYTQHRRSHERARREKERLLEAYSTEEKKTILRFLGEVRQQLAASRDDG